MDKEQRQAKYHAAVKAYCDNECFATATDAYNAAHTEWLAESLTAWHNKACHWAMVAMEHLTGKYTP